MKLKPQDATYEDYVRRRTEAFEQAKLENWTFEQRKAWIDANSPLEPLVRFANLLRALCGDVHNLSSH